MVPRPLTSFDRLLRGRKLLPRVAGLLTAGILAAAGVYAAGVATQPASATTSAGDCTPGSDWGTVRADLASQTIQLVNARSEERRVGKESRYGRMRDTQNERAERLP